MPAVQKSEERKFWKNLCKVFQNLIDDVKNGGGILNGNSSEWRKFMQSDEVDGFLKRIISKMVHTQRNTSATSWREAVSMSHNGRALAKLIRKEMSGPVGTMVAQLISENAAFIKTLPEEWAKYASQYAARMSLKGMRPEEVEAELRKVIPEHMQRNLKCIARTECAKANAAVVEARAAACGIKAYFWRCVKDERSRDSHIGMDGVLVFYDDPPNPEALFGTQKPYGNYHAGNTFNCRCYQEPVVDIEFLPDIIKVHDHGKIVTMTKKQVIDRWNKAA